MKLLLTALLAGLCANLLLASAHGAKGGKRSTRVATFLHKNDVNQDGVIERNEFKGKEKRFKRRDKNHDGKLDEAELEARLAKPKAARKKRAAVS